MNSQSPGNSATMEQRDRTDSNLSSRPMSASRLVTVCALLLAAGYGFVWTVSEPDRHSAVLALSLSWLIDFFAAAMTGKIFRRMNPKRHRFAHWEREGRMYERAGVRAFHWFVLHTPLGWLNPQVQGRCDLDRLLRELSMVEGLHRVGGGVSLAIAAGYVLKEHVRVGIGLALFSVPLHLYPVMLQRWNRGRAWRAQRRMAQEAPGVRSDSTSAHCNTHDVT